MRLLCHVLLLVLALTGTAAAEPWQVPVLVYHRFHPTTASAATVVTTPLFTRQMEAIAAAGIPVLPLRALLDGRPIPPRAIVLTADDGHGSVYTEMFPVLRRLNFPVTLFLNPPVLGHGNFLSWAQIEEMRASGLVEVEPHTMTHPDFRAERARRTPEDFTALVTRELTAARAALRTRLGTPADILAWPFGIHDPDLEAAAQAAGYRAAFALGGRPAREGEPLFALSRYQVYETDGLDRFRQVLAGVPRIPRR